MSTARLLDLWMRSAWGRVAVLLGLVLVYQLAYAHTRLTPGDIPAGRLPELVTLVPVPHDVWMAACWLVFAAGVACLLRPVRVPPVPLGDDSGPRRLAVAVVVVAYGLEAVSRLATGRFAQLGGGLALPMMVLSVGAFGILLVWRPPPFRPLAAVLLAGGVAARIAGVLLVRTETTFADNLLVIQLALGRFFSGATPFGYYEFPTHTQVMPYFPWAFLQYAPPYLAGIDLRVVNVVTAAATMMALLVALRALPMAAGTRRALILSLGVLFVLPKTVTNDVLTEWPLLNLSVVLTFVLVTFGRARLAALAYGVAAGALTVAVYFAVPLLVFAARTYRRRELLRTVAIVAAVAGVPAIAFLLWDPAPFIDAVMYQPRWAYGRLDAGIYDQQNFLFWQRLPGPWLRVVPFGILAITAVVAWRSIRSPLDLVTVAVGSYLALVLTGPLVVPHMFPVALLLLIFAEGLRASRPTPASDPGERSARGAR